MGTGVSFLPSSPHYFEKLVLSKLAIISSLNRNSRFFSSQCHYSFWLSPRSISNGPLRISLCFHFHPIYLIISQGSYFHKGMGNHFLRRVSRLDAFSVYLIHTWLLSAAPGGTTDTPAVCPSRSSRTKDRSSQISYARDG